MEKDSLFDYHLQARPWLHENMCGWGERVRLHGNRLIKQLLLIETEGL